VKTIDSDSATTSCKAATNKDSEKCTLQISRHATEHNGAWKLRRNVFASICSHEL